MPDFTIEIMQQCQSLDPHQHPGWTVGGYRRSISPVTYEIECTCKGYQFRHKCKHAAEVERNRCTWHQNYGAAQTDEQAESMTCPECGGPTMYVKVAV